MQEVGLLLLCRHAGKMSNLVIAQSVDDFVLAPVESFYFRNLSLTSGLIKPTRSWSVSICRCPRLGLCLSVAVPGAVSVSPTLSPQLVAQDIKRVPPFNSGTWTEKKGNKKNKGTNQTDLMRRRMANHAPIFKENYSAL